MTDAPPLSPQVFIDAVNLWRAQQPNGDQPAEGSSSCNERSLAALIKADNQLRLTDGEETVLKETDFHQFPKGGSPGGASSYTFNENLSILRKWKANRNVTHLMVPRDAIVDGVHIGKFIANLRDIKKKKDAGKNVFLTNAQINTLDKEGMVWGGINDVKWHMQFELMKSFIHEHGRLPRQGNKLGDWASNQRRKYAKGVLKQDYINKLNSIQFQLN